MADVFISYSRVDGQFVDQLHDALKKIGRDTWVDWRSIPAGARWEDEIFAGIEAADNFVFIITPESVSSPMCQREVAHASGNSKRIISVLYREVAALPPLLKPFQAIPYSKCGFEETFDRLIAAIDIDPDWERMHSHVLTRAKEWVREKKDSSFLLRGSDLRRAEEWSSTSAASGARRPTTLESQYVDASLQAERKRLQVALVLAMSGIVILGLLSISWLRQRNLAQARQQQAEEARRLETTARREAELQRGKAVASADEATRQRDIAEELRIEADRQRRIALARQLAAQAEFLIGDQPVLSALLTMESIRRCHLLENDHSLRRVLPFVTPKWVRPSTATVVKVGYSSGGGFALSAETLILLDPELRKQFLQIDKKVDAIGSPDLSQDVANYQARVADAFALSADGRYAATGGADGTVRVFEADTGKQVRTLASAAHVTTLALSSRGQYVASGGDDGTVRLFELSTGRLLSQLKVDNGGPHSRARFSSAVFSPDDLFLLAFRDKSIEVISSAGGSAVQHLTFDGEVDAAAVAPGATELAILSGKTLKVVALPTLKEKWHLSLPSGDCCVFRANLSPDGRYLALTGWQGEARIVDLKRGKKILEFSRFVGFGGVTPPPSSLPPVAFSPAGPYIAVANPLEESLSLIDLNTGKEVSNLLDEDILDIHLQTDQFEPLAITPDRSHPVRKGLGPIVGFAFSPDGRYIVVAHRFSQPGTQRPGKTSLVDDETLVTRYAVHIEDLVQEMCSRIPRNLTLAEWRQYIGDEPYQKTCANLQ